MMRTLVDKGLMSHFSSIYLESWFSWFGRRTQKTLKKDETLKNEEKEKQRIQGKSNNNNKHLWFYLLYKKSYFARKHSLKKPSLYHHILFTVFIRFRVFETQ